MRVSVQGRGLSHEPRHGPLFPQAQSRAQCENEAEDKWDGVSRAHSQDVSQIEAKRQGPRPRPSHALVPGLF